MNSSTATFSQTLLLLVCPLWISSVSCACVSRFLHALQRVLWEKRLAP